MTRFFDNSLSELRKRNDGIETSFKKIDSNRFTAVIYKNGNAKARCKITLDNGMNRKEIRYSGDDSLDRNGFNESLSVEHDKQAMFLSAMGMPQFTEFSTKNLTFEGAAEYYWQLLIRYLQ